MGDENERFAFVVEAADQGEAGRGAQALADRLRGAEGVLEVARRKTSPDSMDLGTVVEVVTAVGATAGLAREVATWLRLRREARLTVQRDARSRSLKAAVGDVDAELARRLDELIRRG